MARVVVEQGEGVRPARGRDLDRVVDGAVTPVRPLGELGVVVLGVVDQQVDVAAQLEHCRIHRGRPRGRLLVVAHVGHRPAIPLDAVPEGGPHVGHPRRGDRGVVDLEPAGFGVVEPDMARQRLDLDREVGRREESADHVREWLAGLDRRVEVQLRTCGEQRREEGDPLHVVPVQVREQRGASERFSDGSVRVSSGELGPVHPQSGPQVEDDRRTARTVEHHARGVPPVARELSSGAWRRSAHTVEGDVQNGPPGCRDGPCQPSGQQEYGTPGVTRRVL